MFFESESGNEGIYLSPAFKYLNQDYLFELSFELPITGSRATEMFFALTNKLFSLFKLVYGYGRQLPADVDATTENPIKKGWFGGTSVKVDKATEVWLENPADVTNGAIKGLYEFNIVKSEKLHQEPLKAWLEGREVSVEKLSGDMVLLSLEEEKVSAIKKTFKNSSFYIRD